eukprot:TRINITY_DN13889_c0_g1_i2.p1 TRINITY_DN13889_c0_g1~~TRINITY_DN13889_c0_g1_i2.p1  ORF type:complete len:301 (-),score=30.83 TRINITY_DN13889_c0_g1_i2:92-994(-)
MNKETGIMVFATFMQWYNGLHRDFVKIDETHGNVTRVHVPVRLSRHDDDPFNFFRVVKEKETSSLTQLCFELKNSATKQEEYKNYVRKFNVTLFPHSALFIPLETNRIYTHKTVPPMCDTDGIPLRMGYVIRCSNTKVLFTDHDDVYEADTNTIPKAGAGGVTEAGGSGVPEAGGSGVPEAGGSGVPEAGGSGVPEAGGSGVPEGVDAASSDANSDERSKINTQTKPKKGRAHIIIDGVPHPMTVITPEERRDLQLLYSKENSQIEPVVYLPKTYSMNVGDYMRPNLTVNKVDASLVRWR